MTAFLYSFSHVLTRAILQSLASSLVIYILLAILPGILKNAPPVVRYRLSLAAMLTCLVFFLLPFRDLQYHSSTVVIQYTPHKAPIDFSLSHAIAATTTRHTRSLLGSLSKHSDLILTLYALGVLWFAARLIVAYTKSRQLKNHLLPADGHWQTYLEEGLRKLGMHRQVFLGFSENITSPCVIGYVKATILIPVSLAASLTPVQAEAVLLHELAHLKYLDHYANIAMQSVRCLLFFNPFVWLIARQCNLYRELACDALAAKHGDNISLAESLLQIAKFRNNIPVTAAGLLTHKHSLSFRIQNLLNMNQSTTVTGSKFSLGITTALFTLALLLLTGSRSLSQNKQTLHEKLAAVAQQMYDEGNTNFILVEALNDGLIQERQPYSVIYTAKDFVFNGKQASGEMKDKYVKRYQDFLASRGYTGCGYGSFRGDGLKLEEIFDAKSKFRQKPAPAQMVMPTGQSFTEQVLQSMVNDGLLDSVRADYVIEYKKDGVYLNHKKLEGAAGRKYWKIFTEGEGYIPRTDSDGVRMENHPTRTPHIYIDEKGNQRLEFEDKKRPAEKKDEPARQDR